jgi:hypothetical protein
MRTGSCPIVLGIAALCISVYCTPSFAAEPTLARLCFWVPPERKAEFESAYQTEIAPLLARHGLSESSRVGRTTVDSVFSRLFDVGSLAVLEKSAGALWADQGFQQARRRLGARFGAVGPDSLLEVSYNLYQRPVAAGRTAPAGPGRGHWRTYDAGDGLFCVSIHALKQDRDGYLWFATDGGAYRYDGRTSVALTKRDGLVGNWVFSVLQDRDGIMWFGTSEGLSRYDGKSFTTYTTQQGLAGNYVYSMLQDRDGNMWFGTYGNGVSRYDGKSFTT